MSGIVILMGRISKFTHTFEIEHSVLIAVPVLLHCREMVTRWFST